MPQYGGAIDPSTSGTALQVGSGAQTAVQNLGRFQAGYADSLNNSQRSIVAGTANLGESMARMGKFIFDTQEQKHIQDEAMWLAPLKTFTSSQGLERLSKGDQSGWNFLSSAAGIGAGNPLLSRMNDSIMDAGKAANETFVTSALQTQKQLFDAKQAELDRANALERTKIGAEASMSNTEYRTDNYHGGSGSSSQPTGDPVNTFMQIRNGTYTGQNGASGDPSIVNDNQGTTPEPGTEYIPNPDSQPNADPNAVSPDAPVDQSALNTPDGSNPNGDPTDSQMPTDGQGSSAGDNSTPITPPSDASLQDILQKKDWKLPELYAALDKQQGVKTLPLSAGMTNTAGAVLALTGNDNLPPISTGLSSTGKITLGATTGTLSKQQESRLAGATSVLDGLDDFGSNPTFQNELPKYGGAYEGIRSGRISYEPIDGVNSQSAGKVQFYGTTPEGRRDPIGNPVDKKYIESAEKIKNGYDQVKMAGGDILSVPVGKGKGLDEIPTTPKNLTEFIPQINELQSRTGPNGKKLFTTKQTLDLFDSNLKPTKVGEVTKNVPDFDAINKIAEEKFNSLKTPEQIKKLKDDEAKKALELKLDSLTKKLDWYIPITQDEIEQNKKLTRQANDQLDQQRDSNRKAIGNFFKRTFDPRFDEEQTRNEIQSIKEQLKNLK